MRAAALSSVPAPAMARSVARVLRLAAISSRLLASHTVHVMTEAKASPISTACTTMLALRNMPQGLRSRGSVALPMSAGVGAVSCADAVESHGSSARVK